MHRTQSPGVDINTLRPRQDGRYFPDDIFKCVFLNENVRISMKLSLKFVCKSPINNIHALVQILAWRRRGDKPFFLNQWWLDYWRIYASRILIGLNHYSDLLCVPHSVVINDWLKIIMISKSNKWVLIPLDPMVPPSRNSTLQILWTTTV